MGLLSNRIGKEALQMGDHIYSWRAKMAYAHHGIYVGEDKVIHFTRGGQEVGTGTSFDILLASSSPVRCSMPCLDCSSYKVKDTNGVMASCLSCFLAEGLLYRFEYGVSTAFFLAKVRGGTCTCAAADPVEEVVRRANYLLTNGFRVYSLFKNNCEDFAIYCKTGLLAAEEGGAGIGQSGQAVSALAGGVSIFSAVKIAFLAHGVSHLLAVQAQEVDQAQKEEDEKEDRRDGEESGAGGVSRRMKVIAVAATCAVMAPVVYCVTRYKNDIGNRSSMLKIQVEDLKAELASGRIRTADESSMLLQA